MFVIRAHQMAAFESAAFDTFSRAVRDHLRRIMPHAVSELSEATLLQSVTRRIEQAMSFGLADRSEVRRYVECSYVLRWMDDAPEARALEILERADIGAAQKIDWIEQWAERV